MDFLKDILTFIGIFALTYLVVGLIFMAIWSRNNKKEMKARAKLESEMPKIPEANLLSIKEYINRHKSEKLKEFLDNLEQIKGLENLYEEVKKRNMVPYKIIIQRGSVVEQKLFGKLGFLGVQLESYNMVPPEYILIYWEKKDEEMMIESYKPYFNNCTIRLKP